LVVRTVFVVVHSPVGKRALGGAIWQVPGLCGCDLAAATCAGVFVADWVLVLIHKLAPHPLAPPRRRIANIAPHRRAWRASTTHLIDASLSVL
jgi:hypothetical protein